MARQPYMTLGRLSQLPGEELKSEWARRYGAHAPALSPELLRLGIGYKLQEQRLGGVSRSVRSLLRQLAARASQKNQVKPGSRGQRIRHIFGHSNRHTESLWLLMPRQTSQNRAIPQAHYARR